LISGGARRTSCPIPAGEHAQCET